MNDRPNADFKSLVTYFSHNTATWKQEIPKLWHCNGEIWAELQTPAPEAKSLTAIFLLFNLLDSNSIHFMSEVL